MRIRKRFVIEASQSSDPHLRRRPPPTDPPFDHIMAIRSVFRTWVFTDDDDDVHEDQMKHKKLVIDDAFKEEENKTVNDNIRSVITISSSSADHQEVSNNKRIVLHQPSSSSSATQGNWGEGDKELADPMKKRKDIFDENEAKFIVQEMKHETIINCGNMIQFEVNESTSGGATKKIKRGNVIMEGSRCSRVNGRGWRCCQPTLVGYSLCEHHLGKGRLRSTASARCAEIAESSFGGGEGRKLLPLGVTKKRTKLVKARSLSSLLGQI